MKSLELKVPIIYRFNRSNRTVFNSNKPPHTCYASSAVLSLLLQNKSRTDNANIRNESKTQPYQLVTYYANFLSLIQKTNKSNPTSQILLLVRMQKKRFWNATGFKSAEFLGSTNDSISSEFNKLIFHRIQLSAIFNVRWFFESVERLYFYLRNRNDQITILNHHTTSELF